MNGEDPDSTAQRDEANPYRSFHDPEASRDPAADGFGWLGDAAGSGPAAALAPARGRLWRWLAVPIGYGSDYLITEIADRIWWHVVAERVVSGAAPMPSETTSLLVISFLGTASSVVGGFICGTVARQSEIGFALAQVALGFTIFLGQVWSSGGWGLPGWYYALTIPAVSLATVTGAWLAKRRRWRRAEARG